MRSVAATAEHPPGAGAGHHRLRDERGSGAHAGGGVPGPPDQADRWRAVADRAERTGRTAWASNDATAERFVGKPTQRRLAAAASRRRREETPRGRGG